MSREDGLQPPVMVGEELIRILLLGWRLFRVFVLCEQGFRLPSSTQPCQLMLLAQGMFS